MDKTVEWAEQSTGVPTKTIGFEVCLVGSKTTRVWPLVITGMAERGIDIPAQHGMRLHMVKKRRPDQ